MELQFIRFDDLFIYNNKEKSHSWFNQICVEENRILLCGQISNDFSGESANAWVLAINDNGEELWNNLYDEKYNCVFSCMKNGIGSLLMELYNTNSGNAKIISSDLLCDDTGLCLGTIK